MSLFGSIAHYASIAQSARHLAHSYATQRQFGFVAALEVNQRLTSLLSTLPTQFAGELEQLKSDRELLELLAAVERYGRLHADSEDS